MKNPILEYIRFIKAVEQAKREGRSGELLLAAKENCQIQKDMLRPMRYEMIDGAGEIGWGAAILLFAMSSYTTVILPKTWMWTGWIGMLLCLSGGLAPYGVHKAIKKYITWPRTGYVALRHDTKSWRIGMITGVVVAAGVSIGLTFLLRPEMRQMASEMNHRVAASHGVRSTTDIVLLAGVVASQAILYLMMAAGSIGDHPWKWIVFGLIVLGTTAICLIVPGGFYKTMPPLMLFLGPAWTISGLATLVSYLRHNKPPVTEGE
jgi:hypothetical protein